MHVSLPGGSGESSAIAEQLHQGKPAFIIRCTRRFDPESEVGRRRERVKGSRLCLIEAGARSFSRAGLFRAQSGRRQEAGLNKRSFISNEAVGWD